jgi:Mg2+ and Co2+ transporter CorA
MNRSTVTEDEVQAAMDFVLHQSQQLGRRATIAAVERRLDTTHATFYRNFSDQIAWFKTQTAPHPEPETGDIERPGTKQPAETINDLRRENTQLRRTVAIYAEVIRQLTLDYEESQGQVYRQSGVTTLDSHRNRRT